MRRKVDLKRLEQWQREMEALAAQLPDDPEDDRKIQEALDEADRIAKDYVRREMGLPTEPPNDASAGLPPRVL